MSTFGERFKKIREYYGLTQESLADGLTIDPSYLSYIEKDKKKPSGKVTRKLYQNYNVNPEWLEFGTGDMISGEPAVITPVKKRRILTDMELLETVIVTLEECIAKKRHNFTPEAKGKLVVACAKYFNDVDETTTPNEIKKQVIAIYDVLAKVTNG